MFERLVRLNKKRQSRLFDVVKASSYGGTITTTQTVGCLGNLVSHMTKESEKLRQLLYPK